jgi:predicted RNA methylase
MEKSTQDRWAQWLLHRRFGVDTQQLQVMLAGLAKVRERVLEHARIGEGETVLDVGCGDGLIAFGAVDRPGASEQGAIDEQRRWESFLKSSPNPLVPTIEEAMQQALSADEIEQFTAYLRPLVEKNQRVERSSVAYLWAVK